MHSAVSSRSTGIPRVRTVTLDHPWHWLSAGWLDITTTPGVSFTYGALFTVAGFLLVAGLDRLAMDYLILPLAFGFALIGPAAAVGLYETSRRMMLGRDASLGDAVGAFRRNPAQIGLVGVFLALAFIAWVRLAVLEFMLFFGSSPPPLDGFVSALLMSDQSVAFLAVGTLTGAIMAALVFAMTAIAIPMLVDRPEVDAMTAMLTSLEAVRVNWKPMALWAFLIAFFTFFGLAMFFIGLILTLPLIGHASWHAYRDLVVNEN
jgi:uncharacterized membrane protein